MYKVETSNAALDTEIRLVRKGIAWESDRKYGFKNPEKFSDKNDPIWESFVKPKGKSLAEIWQFLINNETLILNADWNRWLWDLDPEDPENNGILNEDLIVRIEF